MCRHVIIIPAQVGVLLKMGDQLGIYLYKYISIMVWFLFVCMGLYFITIITEKPDIRLAPGTRVRV